MSTLIVVGMALGGGEKGVPVSRMPRGLARGEAAKWLVPEDEEKSGAFATIVDNFLAAGKRTMMGN